MLTEKRKADRAEMARRIHAMATAQGAQVTIEEMGPREIWVRIEAPRGLRLTIDFDGDSNQPDTHVLSWHMSPDVDTCLSDAFGRAVCGSLNPYHWRKATSVGRGFDEAYQLIETGLALAATGEAFDAAREAAAIAKAGETAAQRCARYDAYFTASRA